MGVGKIIAIAKQVLEDLNVTDDDDQTPVKPIRENTRQAATQRLRNLGKKFGDQQRSDIARIGKNLDADGDPGHAATDKRENLGEDEGIKSS